MIDYICLLGVSNYIFLIYFHWILELFRQCCTFVFHCTEHSENLMSCYYNILIGYILRVNHVDHKLEEGDF